VTGSQPANQSAASSVEIRELIAALATLEAMVHDAKGVPLTADVRIDSRRITALLTQMRASLDALANATDL
jgi:hypothetical protein